jgi:aryl-alcohol dehydrogenase-like predicted oxidoreductase
MISQRTLGKTGVQVSCIGLGGEGILRTVGQKYEAGNVIDKALDLGINYFESARAYADSESYYGFRLGARRLSIFLASKAHARDAEGAEQMLAQTLHNMETDWLDLWQVHDVRSEEDLETIFGPGGAIETFDRAKKEGTVRFVGITGHENPDILLKAFDLYDFDTVLMPVNPAEPAWNSFLDTVLPEAVNRDMGVIGMKVLCHGFGRQVPGCEKADTWLRYALGHDISTMVVGCDDPGQVDRNVAAVKEGPLSEEERARLEMAVAPYARRLMSYK